MKPYTTLFQTLVLWLFTADTALASAFAGPYEALIFYHSYLAEWEGTPNRRGPTTTIAPGCFSFYPSSPNVRKPCTFDEFFNEAYKKKPGYTHPNVESLTVDEAARLIYDSGFANAQYNKEKLVQGLTVRNKHEHVIAKIGDTVQKARKNGVGGVFIENVIDAISRTRKERSQDQWRGMERDMKNDWNRKYGIELAFKDGVSPLGRPSRNPDFEKSLRTLKARLSQGEYDKRLQSLKDEGNWYLNHPSTKGGQHKAPMVALGKMENSLRSPLPCPLDAMD